MSGNVAGRDHGGGRKPNGARRGLLLFSQRESFTGLIAKKLEKKW